MKTQDCHCVRTAVCKAETKYPTEITLLLPRRRDTATLMFATRCQTSATFRYSLHLVSLLGPSCMFVTLKRRIHTICPPSSIERGNTNAKTLECCLTVIDYLHYKMVVFRGKCAHAVTRNPTAEYHCVSKETARLAYIIVTVTTSSLQFLVHGYKLIFN